MDEPKYKRVLLKISGEALAGDKHFGLDFQVMGRVADVIKECSAMGVEIGVVIGGGNFWRGVKNGEGYIERSRADHMGMLATAMNCMAMADVLEQKGVDVRVMTSLEIRAVAEDTLKIQLDGRLERYLDAAREVCTRQGAAVCDCYAKWKLLSQNGVDTTALLANGINHPSREMAWMFAYSLLETMMR